MPQSYLGHLLFYLTWLLQKFDNLHQLILDVAYDELFGLALFVKIKVDLMEVALSALTSGT
ncbi:MAG: hypothetical protein Q4B79_01580 [Moraxella sp.]|uniref:hypothetical protein n=1 Tax=Moraxella sp. TaxID=479 RepID=UPI0026DC8F0E|nr:hypothetical protein [Moraxella sp.]MDO4449636.1 hypothetical protein [Moraxella sp.]